MKWKKMVVTLVSWLCAGKKVDYVPEKKISEGLERKLESLIYGS